jgi:hypothetical protein
MCKFNFCFIAAAAFLALPFLVPAATAQTNFSGGLHFNVGFPEGELKEQIDRNAYGLGGQFFFSPQKSLFAIGAEVGWMNYGQESRREPFSTTIPDVTVKVTTSNNIVQAFLILRAGMPIGPIRPYGDGLVGLNYLFTETKITDADDESEEVASSVNLDDAALAYGFGGGVMVLVYSGKADNERPFEVLIDIGVRYVLGNEAQYLKEGSIRREGGRVEYDLLESKTDMVRLHIGVMGRF